MDLAEKIKAIPCWYHKIALPDGTVTPGFAPIDAQRYCIPDDLTGKRVLDIGAWDGYWTWEALKRGAAEVVAIDDFSDYAGLPGIVERNGWESFDICREAFGFTQEISARVSDLDNKTDGWINEKGQHVRRIEMSVYDIEQLGKFDVVFFFGTIYHLKNPIQALEAISAVCNGAIYVETASLDDCSPYRGGVGRGFNQNEVVMEFYAGKQYGDNEGNWWVPTLECLGAMLKSAGFVDIECWPLKENPKKLIECRGFASGTKDPAVMPATRPADISKGPTTVSMKVAAVMSVPRLGFSDNMTCACEALFPLRIPLINVQGAFWGQCLERGMQQLIDGGIDIVVTIDYDTAFKKKDVEDLLRLMHFNPDVAAIVPIQRGRGNFPVLISMKTITGQARSDVPLTELQQADTAKIATGHFALSAFRVKDLLDMPHPWFHDQPNNDGQWGPGRVDADIYFWKKMEKCGKKVLLANRIVVGHLELKVHWPDKDLQPIYQTPGDYHDKGKPENVWK